MSGAPRSDSQTAAAAPQPTQSSTPVARASIAGRGARGDAVLQRRIHPTDLLGLVILRLLLLPGLLVCLELSDDTSKFWFAKYIRDRSALQKMGTVVPSQSGTLRETIQTLTTALRVNASPCYQLAQLQQIKKYGSQQEAHATFHKVRHRIAQHTSIHIPYRMPLCTPNLRVADGQLVQNEKYFSCTTCNTYSTHYLSMQLSQ